MKRNVLFGCLMTLLTVGLVAGCGADFHARQIVEHKIDGGQFMQNLIGSGEQMVKSGRIDAHRRIDGADKTEIDVWVLNAHRDASKESRGTVIILHRLYEHKALFPYFGAGEKLAAKGFDVVLIDLRAHGRSEGKYITYGAKEKLDVKAVVDALAGEGLIHTPIYAFGVEHGGSTAIQYAAIDPRCKGVMAMTAFTDIRPVARARLRLLPPEKFQAALERAGKIADFDPADASARKAATKLENTPLLLVYGIFDLTVPSAHGIMIYNAAAGPKRLIDKPMLDFAVIENWIADQMESLAVNGLDGEQQ